MKRTFCTLLIAATLAVAPAWADPVTLRDHIEANGSAITLGDVFSGAGASAGRAIAPAPAPGQVTTLSLAVLTTAASVAGLDWTAPAGLNGVRVTRPGGARATLPAQSAPAPVGASTQSIAGAAVHKNEMVMLVYRMPGIELTARARALEDGAVGQSIRLVNPTSTRTIDATVTGPGAADANGAP